MPQCTKQGPQRYGLLRVVWKNLCGLFIALTSSPVNTFGVNWWCSRPPYPTSLMLSPERPQIPTDLFFFFFKKTKLCRKPYLKSGVCYSSKEGTWSVLMPMVLEWDIQEVHRDMMVRIHTFGHIVCVYLPPPNLACVSNASIRLLEEWLKNHITVMGIINMSKDCGFFFPPLDYNFPKDVFGLES